MSQEIDFSYVANEYYQMASKDKFLKFAELIQPIVDLSEPKKNRVHTEMYLRDSETNKATKLKLGTLKWNDTSFTKIFDTIDSYNGEQISMLPIKAEFPSIISAYKASDCPKLLIDFINCGASVSIREDIFEKLGKEHVERIIKDIATLFTDTEILYRKAPIFSELMVDTDNERIQDYIALIHKMNLKRNHQPKKWQKITI